MQSVPNLNSIATVENEGAFRLQVVQAVWKGQEWKREGKVGWGLGGLMALQDSTSSPGTCDYVAGVAKGLGGCVRQRILRRQTIWRIGEPNASQGPDRKKTGGSASEQARLWRRSSAARPPASERSGGWWTSRGLGRDDPRLPQGPGGTRPLRHLVRETDSGLLTSELQDNESVSC